MQKGTQSVSAFLYSHPVFTGQEFADFLKSRGSGNPRTHEALLRYYRKRGAILQLRRGLYSAVPPGIPPEQAPVDPFLVAAKLAPDAVLAYHTALEVHGRSYSAHNRLVYLTSKYQSGFKFEFRQTAYQSVRPPTRLRVSKPGIETADRSGQQVRVTSLERTLVDVLDRPRLSGGWEEVWRSLETIPYLDLDQLAEYALQLGNSTTTARVGFFLSQHRNELSVGDDLLKRLQLRRPKNPKYFTNDTTRSGRLISEWNLIVPESILTKSWDEPA